MKLKKNEIKEIIPVKSQFVRVKDKHLRKFRNTSLYELSLL